jgi:hypothetical protein
MMIYTGLLALFAFHNVWGTTTAFSVNTIRNQQTSRDLVSLQSSPSSSDTDVPVFPVGLPFQRLQGGGTVRTYQIPGWADRVQMEIRTNGRPLRATAQLWLGPIRNVHTMQIDSQDGLLSPYRAGLKFKADGQGRTLKISTSESQEMPIDVAVTVPSVERSVEIGAVFDNIWDNSDKIKVQGAVVGSGDAGSVRTFPVDSDVDAVQFLCWSKDTGKKSLKAKIEVLQGPNNRKQVYDLQCGGSTQPFHAVFETPGAGWVVRIVNKKNIEDGLFQAVLVPYNLGDAGTTIGKLAGGVTPTESKQWWQ